MSDDVIQRPAAAPDADLACDFAIAAAVARTREELAAAMIGPARRIGGGVEARFRGGAWDDVRRYVEVESQCCPFLDLDAKREGEVVVLRVTGRPDAKPVIEAIFGGDAANAG